MTQTTVAATTTKAITNCRQVRVPCEPSATEALLATWPYSCTDPEPPTGSCPSDKSAADRCQCWKREIWQKRRRWQRERGTIWKWWGGGGWPRTREQKRSCRRSWRGRTPPGGCRRVRTSGDGDPWTASFLVAAIIIRSYSIYCIPLSLLVTHLPVSLSTSVIWCLAKIYLAAASSHGCVLRTTETES